MSQCRWENDLSNFINKIKWSNWNEYCALSMFNTKKTIRLEALLCRSSITIKVSAVVFESSSIFFHITFDTVEFLFQSKSQSWIDNEFIRRNPNAISHFRYLPSGTATAATKIRIESQTCDDSHSDHITCNNGDCILGNRSQQL